MRELPASTLWDSSMCVRRVIYRNYHIMGMSFVFQVHADPDQERQPCGFPVVAPSLSVGLPLQWAKLSPASVARKAGRLVAHVLTSLKMHDQGTRRAPSAREGGSSRRPRSAILGSSKSSIRNPAS